MRKLALLVPVVAVLFSCQFASAQQADAMFFVGTLLSSSPSTGSLESGELAEKGGTYLGVAGDVVFKRRIGFNVETSWRASQASYFGYESYRPILTDFNAIYQPKLGKKIGLDLFGGIGIATTRFYVPFATSCSGFTGQCINYTSTHNFMQDLGVGVRYYVWKHAFVRPEFHYYHIDGNDNINSGGFSTDNVFRVGASIGYTIGND
ncbi:MAG TPA: outer membrane beta-barrel protein [Candidatus Deferrimicrobiaceae bacterium]|nr:outer membrane beta-barrel protein [Candidatus Deferrimicrobiaceae bacterium]